MSEESNLNAKYEGWPLNLIAAWPKVLEILDGKIPVPEVVEVFPTNFCNFACPHCRFRDYHGSSESYMDTSVLYDLLIELSNKGVRAIESGTSGKAGGLNMGTAQSG
ncbi:MAG: hypothetical protein HQK60_03915 [Deltaproteobacteria bacterium]|nr:hypothetical protein [Deltaproteobacteria bacterium]